MAAVKVPIAAQAANPELPLPVTMQITPGQSYAAAKAECAELEAHIKHLDSMARQPQDWVQEEPKKARDRQVRIPCS